MSPDGLSGKGRRGNAVAATIAAATVALAAAMLLRGAASTTRTAAEGACSALRPNPLSATLRQLRPDFELHDLEGKSVSMRSLRGRPVLVSFFATWCPPCVEEAPSLEVLAGRLGDKARVVVVSVDEDADALRKFYAHGSLATVLRDQSRRIPMSFGTSKYPESFLVDPAGKVRYAFINKRDWSMPEAAACVLGLR
jgi:thiol-disulfide isomerase/thioredoxin